MFVECARGACNVQMAAGQKSWRGWGRAGEIMTSGNLFETRKAHRTQAVASFHGGLRVHRHGKVEE